MTALQDNNGNSRALDASGTFALATQIASGLLYNATVLTQPAGQSCTLTNGGGTVGTLNVTSVNVSCTAPPP